MEEKSKYKDFILGSFFLFNHFKVRMGYSTLGVLSSNIRFDYKKCYMVNLILNL